MSRDLLKLLEDRENYLRFAQYIRPHLFAQEELKIVFNEMGAWFQNNLAPIIDWDSFNVWLHSRKKLGEEQGQLLSALFLQLKSCKPPDTAAYKEIVHAFIIKDIGRQLGEIGLKAHDGEIDNIDDAHDLLVRYDQETAGIVDPTMHEISQDIDDVLTNISVGGYDWGYDFFNQALGPLRQGDFIVIASRPDGGKTSLLCNLANHLAKQLPLSKKVMIFNNEGSGSKYRLRLWQSALNKTYLQIMQDPKAAKQRYDAIIGGPDRIIVVDNPRITTELVEKKVMQHDPGIIIFDQLYKVHGFSKAKDDVGRQAQLFQWARELAKAQGPTITVHQADVSAEGTEYIGMSQLYGSKTSIQGEADAIITIGQSKDPAKAASRFFFIPKNKLIGGPKSNPAMRHGRAEMVLVPDTGRFIE